MSPPSLAKVRAHLHERASSERWPSGLRRTLGKRVCGKPYRGFESHSLRHLYATALPSIRLFESTAKSPKNSALMRQFFARAVMFWPWVRGRVLPPLNSPLCLTALIDSKNNEPRDEGCCG